jgi:hypothetical protein
MKPNLIKMVTVVVLVFGGRQDGWSQGTFQNLDFESPILPLVSSGNPNFNFVYISNAMPGWSGYVGAEQQSSVLYNNEFLGTAVIAFNGPGATKLILGGSYTVLLQPGSGPTGMHVGAAIAQMGTIPSDALSLRFFSSLNPIGGQLEIAIDGQNLPFFALSQGPNYTIYGSDISGFAGQMHELRFTTLYTGTGPNNVYLDSISFSPVAIPEPSVFGLFALATLLFGWRLPAKQR